MGTESAPNEQCVTVPLPQPISKSPREVRRLPRSLSKLESAQYSHTNVYDVNSSQPRSEMTSYLICLYDIQIERDIVGNGF